MYYVSIRRLSGKTIQFLFICCKKQFIVGSPDVPKSMLGIRLAYKRSIFYAVILTVKKIPTIVGEQLET